MSKLCSEKPSAVETHSAGMTLTLAGTTLLVAGMTLTLAGIKREPA